MSFEVATVRNAHKTRIARPTHSQSYEEVPSVVALQRQPSSPEVHVNHGQQILQNSGHARKMRRGKRNCAISQGNHHTGESAIWNMETGELHETKQSAI